MWPRQRWNWFLFPDPHFITEKKGKPVRQDQLTIPKAINIEIVMNMAPVNFLYISLLI